MISDVSNTDNFKNLAQLLKNYKFLKICDSSFTNEIIFRCDARLMM